MELRQSSRPRLAFAAIAMLSGVLSLTSSVLLDLSRLEHGKLVADSAYIVRLGANHAGLFRWSGLLVVVSYLLLLPLAVYLRNQLLDAHPTTVDVGAIAAVISGSVGAAGGAVWASATPLISAYAGASPSDRPQLAVMFATVLDVGTALWHFVEGPATAVWFASIAISLRERWRGFAAYSAILAVAIALGSLGTMLVPNGTSSVPFTLFFLPVAVWPMWLALRIWRDGRPVGCEA